MEATGMTTSEHAHNEEKETEADGEKAGRVIGSKAAAELKSMLNDAVDGFIAKMNGSATDEKAVDVPRIPDPKEAPPKETAEGDKADFQKGYADGSAGRPALPHGTKQYERGYADGVKDRAAVDQQEIDRLEQQLSGLEIKPRV